MNPSSVKTAWVLPETDRRLGETAAALRANPAEVPERVAALIEDRKKLERQVAELQRKLATGGAAASALEEIGGITLAVRNLGDIPARELKGIAETIAGQTGAGVVALASTAEGKVSISSVWPKRHGPR